MTVYIDPSMRPVGFNLPLMTSLIPQGDFSAVMKQANSIGDNLRAVANGGAKQP